MAWEGVRQIVPNQAASADLSSYQYTFVKVGSAGVVNNTVNGDLCEGVLQDAPAAAGRSASVCYAGVSKVKAGAAVLKGADVMSNTVGKAITAVTVATAATDVTTAAPWDFAPADTMVVDVDNVGNATATFDATQGYEIDDTTYPVSDQATKSILVTIDGVANPVTFVGTTTTAAHVIAEINAQISGGSAEASTSFVKVLSDTYGTDSTVVLTDVDSGLSFGNAAVDGTGDVGDINAVSAAEFKTVVEADTTATVTINADDTCSVFSPTTGATSELEFVSGNVLALVGISVAVVTGEDSNSHVMGKALSAAGAADEILSVLLAKTKV
ncbi:MAG: hypothetical protein GY854_31100 [Deltaproteobacteria bacterium]|nr:hypothetical protein [Deltaproteobacteria bacterium]